MKFDLIITDGVTQLNMTPESDHEKTILGLFNEKVDLSVVVKRGSFYDERKQQPFSVDISRCAGGYLRAFDSTDSVMLVITEKPKQNTIHE